MMEEFTKPASQFFYDIFLYEASRDSLCDCYGGRCQRIVEKSAYMVGITRDLGKQRRLIFPVATKGNACRVFVFFGFRINKV